MGAVAQCILHQPPPLCQLLLYKGTEGMYACWATAAEMVAKWKTPSAWFVRPTFESRLGNTIDEKAEYMMYIEDWLNAWGFQTQLAGSIIPWTPVNLATVLNDKGPLLCTGYFDRERVFGQIGGDIHAVAVYGYDGQHQLVLYVDPWDATAKTMTLADFNRQLLRNSNKCVYARIPNYRIKGPAGGKG